MTSAVTLQPASPSLESCLRFRKRRELAPKVEAVKRVLEAGLSQIFVVNVLLTTTVEIPLPM